MRECKYNILIFGWKHPPAVHASILSHACVTTQWDIIINLKLQSCAINFVNVLILLLYFLLIYVSKRSTSSLNY